MITYEQVRYHSRIIDDECTIYLRNAIRSLSDKKLIGTEVNKHGAEGTPPKVVIDLELVIERIPMRLDPYSKELEQLVPIDIEL